MTAKSSRVLVWIDLEMTGLSPKEDVILEMAMILTDRELRPLIKPWRVDIWQPQSVLAAMGPFVRKMHEKTGLLERVRTSQLGVHDAQRQAMEQVSAHAPYRRAILSCNSVHHDRQFLQAHMPHLENYLHYRQIDVSSLKEAVCMWGGKAFEKPKEGKHTALGDIEQSIAELAHYRQAAMLPQLQPRTSEAAPGAPAL